MRLQLEKAAYGVQCGGGVGGIGGEGDVAVRPDKCDAGVGNGAEFQGVGEGLAKRFCRFGGRRRRAVIDQQQKTIGNSLPATDGIVEITFAGAVDDGASLVSDAEFGEALDKGMLEGCETRNHRDNGVPESLSKFVGSAHDLGEAIGGVDDFFDHGKTLGIVAVEQFLVATAMENEIEFPDEIPDILQASVHALATERAVNVRGIARQEHAAGAQLGDVTMMDAEVSAPVQRDGLDAVGTPFSENLAYKFERRSVARRMVDGGYDAAASRTHRENRYGPQFTGTELHAVRREAVVGLNVGEEEGALVSGSSERNV